MQRAPILVLNATTKRDQGRKAQLGNITAAKAVSDIIRTALGPKSMLKMILSMGGGIVMTSDGNAILREIDVVHPSAKSMIELSRAQDEEVGDGTTSVIVLAGEILTMAEPWIERGMHPKVIINGFTKALDDSLAIMKSLAVPVDLKNRSEMLNIVRICLNTKFVSTFYPATINELALDAVLMVATETPDGRKEADIKRFIRIEKIPGGSVEDCQMVPGVVLNKDVVHAKMARRIENPRIITLDCNLEYKKGDNMTNMDFSNPDAVEEALRQEEEAVKTMVDHIAKFKPTLVLTEKGVSDLAQHYFVKYGISVLRRLKKTDNDRVARATGAKIVNRPEDIKESDVGTRCGLFEVQKIGDDHFAFITKCDKPKACTILLRGTGKDTLQEVERNLHDALHAARNVILEPYLLPGGGAIEMALSTKLQEKAKSLPGVEQYPYAAIASALEVIPRTLIQNCGVNVIRTLTALRAKHSLGEGHNWGINGVTGQVCDVVADLQLLEPLAVKVQTLKTAIEASSMLLRVDDIVSGISKKGQGGPSMGGGPAEMDEHGAMPDFATEQ